MKGILEKDIKWHIEILNKLFDVPLQPYHAERDDCGDFDLFQKMIYAAITSGVTFASYVENDYYTIEYTGGF